MMQFAFEYLTLLEVRHLPCVSGGHDSKGYFVVSRSHLGNLIKWRLKLA
jgi:hypothetical protein